MKKPILLVVAALLSIGIGTTAFAADINVNVENEKVAWTDAKPFIKDGRTLVPLRPIAEAMGLEVNWRRERLPTPVFWPGEFHGLYSQWGCKESDTAERLSLSSSCF